MMSLVDMARCAGDYVTPAYATIICQRALAQLLSHDASTRRRRTMLLAFPHAMPLRHAARFLVSAAAGDITIYAT